MRVWKIQPLRANQAALFLLGLSLLLVTACSGMAGESDSASNDMMTDGDAYWVDGDATDGDYIDPNSPEMEDEETMSLPVIGKDYLYILNREAGTLVMIHGETRAIRSIQVGQQPAVVATLPGQDVALVIDKGTDKLALVTQNAAEAVSWPLDRRHQTGYNSISPAPSGNRAIVYFNSTTANLSVDGLGSLQDIGVVDLSDAENLSELDDPISHFTVGLNPVMVHWSPDGQRAYVVTDAGITMLDFSDSAEVAVTPNIQLEDVQGDPVDREVKITADGAYALVRRFDQATLTAVNLATHERQVLTLPSAPTDLDLLPDGSEALVTLRSEGQVARIPIPGGFADETSITWLDLPEHSGLLSVSADGETLLLYSTGTEKEEIYSYDMTGNVFTKHILQKGVASVTFATRQTDGEQVALIFHTKKAGSGSNDYYELIDQSYGYTVLHLSSLVQVLQLTEADPGAFTFTPDGKKGYVLVTDEAQVRKINILDLTPPSGTLISELSLGSTPTGLGVIPATGMVYVSQDHPDGRITFLSADDDSPSTITGFELNGRID